MGPDRLPPDPQPEGHRAIVRRSFVWPALVVVYFAALSWSVVATELSPQALLSGSPRFWAIFSSLFQPDWEIMPEVLERALQTFQISIVSVSFGAIMAFPVSFIAAKNLMSGSRLGSGIYSVSRIIVNLDRSIPDLFWALVFVASVGLGPFPGVLALTMVSFGMLGKLFSEAIESIDPGPLEAVTATGASRTQVIVYAVVPQIVPAFIGHFLYAWEINVRVATIVGMVGAGGLGFLLRTYMSFFQYRAAATVILVTMIMVMAIDFGSARIRARVV